MTYAWCRSDDTTRGERRTGGRELWVRARYEDCLSVGTAFWINELFKFATTLYPVPTSIRLVIGPQARGDACLVFLPLNPLGDPGKEAVS